jgi:hypothetical protein
MLLDHPDIVKMEMYGTLDDREPLCRCDNCGEDIYDGYYLVDGIKYCKGCMEDMWEYI